MISSSRLHIAPWTESEVTNFFDLTQDNGFNLFPITIYRQADLGGAQNWIKNTIAVNQETGLGKWAVYEKASGGLIGMGGLSPWTLDGEVLIDITYRLRTSAWGRGLGLELAQTLIDFGFNHKGLKEITATITPDNIPSKKIAEKVGLKFDKRITLLGVPTDLYRLRKSPG